MNDTPIHPHPVVRYNLMRLLQTVLRNISDSLESISTSSRVHEELEQFLQKVQYFRLTLYVFPPNTSDLILVFADRNSL